jgi:hypothetical protein
LCCYYRILETRKFIKNRNVLAYDSEVWEVQELDAINCQGLLAASFYSSRWEGKRRQEEGMLNLLS